jgi:hypothetical protein
VSLGNKPDLTGVEPTVERIRDLLEIIRSKEDKYQSILETLNVFNMLNPMKSLKSYTDESNIDEIKILYNRFIKLISDKKTIQIHQTFIEKVAPLICQLVYYGFKPFFVQVHISNQFFILNKTKLILCII